MFFLDYPEYVSVFYWVWPFIIWHVEKTYISTLFMSLPQSSIFKDGRGDLWVASIRQRWGLNSWYSIELLRHHIQCSSTWGSPLKPSAERGGSFYMLSFGGVVFTPCPFRQNRLDRNPLLEVKLLYWFSSSFPPHPPVHQFSSMVVFLIRFAYSGECLFCNMTASICFVSKTWKN